MQWGAVRCSEVQSQQVLPAAQRSWFATVEQAIASCLQLSARYLLLAAARYLLFAAARYLLLAASQGCRGAIGWPIAHIQHYHPEST